jgi:hypothetical protein
MATGIQVAGLATIQVDTGNSHALETLGYSINGVEIEENIFTLPVHGDEHGGDSGPPIDIQYLGQVDTVRMELTKYDLAVLDKLRARLWNSGFTAPTAGQVLSANIGSLFFAGSFTFRLTIDCANSGYDRDYIKVIFQESISENRGVKHSVPRLTATCYREPSPGAGSARVYDSSVVAISLPGDPVFAPLGAPVSIEDLAQTPLGGILNDARRESTPEQSTLAAYAYHWPELAGRIRYLFGSFSLGSTERLLTWIQATRKIDEAAAMELPLEEVLQMLIKAGAKFKTTGELSLPIGR